MTNNLKVGFATIALTVFQLALFAQKPNYSGTWALNFDKSKLDPRPPGLLRSEFVIKQQADIFSLTRYHIFEKKKKKISFKMLANGKTTRVKILFKGKLEWKGNDLVSTLWRKNFLNTVHYKFGRHKDELVADEVFKGRPKDHHSIWVFERKIK